MTSDAASWLPEALRVLGIRRLALGVHESAFPPGAVDCGHGSLHACSPRVFAFARRLGFDALQLGPGGQIEDGNPSPYDGAVFARNLLRLDPLALAGPEVGGLLAPGEVERIAATEPGCLDRAEPQRARRLLQRMLEPAHASFSRLQRERPDHPAVQACRAFRAAAADWIELDARYEAVAAGGGEEPAAVERAVLAQWLLDEQAQEVHRRAHAAGLSLFGDLQIGWSVRDRVLRPELFAADWLLGAPPSRTNPQGQPWGYPLLDPDQLDDAHSPARVAFARQLRWLLRGHDGLRVDHPHGLVCPWIHRRAATDAFAAVRAGTRAFESPDRGEPELQRWAIARGGDLDPTVPRHADGWVARLDDAQVVRYARLVDVVLAEARAHGCAAGDVVMEVLSTCPTPLAAVLQRAGLGRFVVTQKADPADGRDVYRTDRARPQDWVMLGNHDTEPILTVAGRWFADGSAGARSAYLAGRLEPDPEGRAAAARRICASPESLAQAHLADLFVGPARQVLVYFTDLFGEREPYNRAGIVHPDNWTLRWPADCERVYEARRAEGRALDVAAAVAQALRARGAPAGLIAASRR